MKMNNDSNTSISVSPGKIRPAQLITTYGPGAFVQMENDSVMIMGIDFWRNKEQYLQKHHLYLQKITKRDHFRMPYSKEDNRKTIACRSYPEWGHCNICKWLQRHKTAPESTDHFVCRTHTKNALLPARLVLCCKRGHISDFPWVEWAHSNPKDPKPICESPKIRWYSGNRSSSISDSQVACDCGAQNYLTNALSRNGVVLHNGDKEYTCKCKGELPWLNKQVRCKKILENGETDDSETETPVAMLARATSLYYPKIIRGIIIPHLAHPVARFLQSEEYRPFEELPILKKMNYEEKAQQIIESNYNNLAEKFEIDEIVNIMKKIEENESKFNIETEDELKEIEYDDLVTSKVYDDEDEKEIQITDVKLDDKDMEYFDIVRKLDILTAIEVSRYFTRLRPPGEINDRMDNVGKKYICGLEVAGKSKSDVKHRKNNWLPCVIKKGEGIFIIFNKKFVESCLNKLGIGERLEALLDNYQKWEKESGWPRVANIDKQYVLLHSFSHILIKEFAQLSGYSEASISERIYSSKNMCGVLIYTTSSGDGSLGGLVKQANHLREILENALEKAESCSRDPICIHEDPSQMIKNGVPLHLAQNGSACYGCIMLPETSCECFNKMLDRKTLPIKNSNIDEISDD